MKFEILDIDALGRIGKLMANSKKMITPNLFPVIHPLKNIVSTSDLKKIGAQSIFTNSYIIYQNEKLREDVLNKGIHQYTGYDGLIATDSGAFQQYMYNNKKMNIDAEEIESFQEKIGSDFPVILDLPVQLDDSYDMAKKKVYTTLERAKDNIKRRIDNRCHWFGPIHGGKYFDLLKFSSIEMSKLKFDVFAIGGLVKAFIDYRFDLTLQMLLTVKKSIIPNKPIHMFGLGLPQFFSLAVACGCDIMDSAAYVLYAKNNRYFTLSTGTKNLEELKEFPCHCPICTKYTPEEIKKFDDNLRIELIAKHNLYLSFSELRTIRQAIREGNLWELVEQRIKAHPNLVEAAKIIEKEVSLFDVHEKIYKNHGRMYVSTQSLNRPLIYRYEEKMESNYRVPIEAKYLIILPELDVKQENSPSLKKWIEEINNNLIIHRKYLHVVFFSEIYGVVPYELSNVFPLGQYETIKSSHNQDLLYQNSLKKLENFFKLYSKNYEKYGVLIPENYLNQFKEIVGFPINNPIYSIYPLLNPKFNDNISNFKNIENMLQFFKNGEKD